MAADDPPVTPLSARSTVLSLLLGWDGHRMSPADLTRAGAYFGIASSTIRAALARAVASGDLHRDQGDYVLGDRLIVRQHRQDAGVEDAEKPWDGLWEMAVVTATARPAAARAELRDKLAHYRLAELREGVWMRPANLRRAATYATDPTLETFQCRPEGKPSAIASDLWDLGEWARRGHQLLDLLATTSEPAPRLAVAAQSVRHLASDPLLPGELLPPNWPGNALRAKYVDYATEIQVLAIA